MSMHVVATALGGPEVLALVDEPDRAPGPGEVVLDVRAAGVNPIDSKRYAGGFGPPPVLPLHLGSEAAGRGARGRTGCDRPARSGGGRRRGHRVPHRRRVRRARGRAGRVDGPQAAHPRLGARVGADAHGRDRGIHALTVVGLADGETLLFHGGAGGVGITAIQVAVDRGACGIATARVANHAFLHALGAEPITYGPGLLERVRAVAPDGVDAAIDGVGSPEALQVSLAAVKDAARFTTIVGSRAAFDAGVKVLGGAPGADPGTEIRLSARP